MPSFADIILIRHGESEANAAGRFACRSWDPALTATGRAQAQQLAHQWHNAPIRYLVTSPLLRAQETLAPLAQDHDLTPVILPDLAEVNLGQWDGKRLRDLEEAESPSFIAWRQDPDRNPPPGGESIRAVGQRVLNALAHFVEPRERHTLTIAATHADCIKGAVSPKQYAGSYPRFSAYPRCKGRPTSKAAVDQEGDTRVPTPAESRRLTRGQPRWDQAVRTQPRFQLPLRASEPIEPPTLAASFVRRHFHPTCSPPPLCS
ncbi:histidine phosphatase family protein [Sulfobacillus thermotolerans]|uniref:histidine phosphatase family protein n=1 Tax=Sulfobacillus thermotolerans TaxID=338644 RepID=UPI003366CA13